MRQEFEETVTVSATPDEAWQAVSDIPRVLGWISIVGAVSEAEPPGQRYGAVLEDRLGPFKLRADLDIAVLAREAPARIAAYAEGEDRQIGSRLVVDVELRIEPAGAETRVAVSGAYEVTGRPAALGAGSIRKKAGRVLGEFFERLSQTGSK